jgi:RNA polymerase sigma factor (sigma-70 family)
MTSTTTEPQTTVGLRKLQPTATMPTAAVLNALGEFDVRLLQQRLQATAECIYEPQFASECTRLTLLGPMPGSTAAASACDDSGIHGVAFNVGAAPTGDQEIFLFRRFNYCRHRSLEVLRSYAGRRLNAQGARDLLSWEHLIRETRGEIVRVNMPLVQAMAKRTRITSVDPTELISEGNLALLRAVEKFDCHRGFKFSTYACRAILKSFSRVATRTSRYRGYFPVEFDPTLERGDLLETKRGNAESESLQDLRAILGDNLARLNQAEEAVIRARFALDEHEHPIGGTIKGKTLEQVGEIIGVTKERVRQIQNKALGKLRVVLERSLAAG